MCVMLCVVLASVMHQSQQVWQLGAIASAIMGMAACSIQQAYSRDEMGCVLSVHACDVLCVVRPDPGGGIQISSKIRHQALVAIDKPKQAFVAVNTTEYTDHTEYKRHLRY